MKISQLINKIFNIKTAHAHCDIPCGIYTPDPALTAAKTVLKMAEKIGEINPPNPLELASGKASELKNRASSLMRCVLVKEEHAQICKKELLILWTDYFKEEHLAMFPDLHKKFWEATKLCSANKREVSIEKAQELKRAVEEIAEMFAKAEAVK